MGIHQVYSELNEQARAATDEAWKAVAFALRAHGFHAAGDDRAEVLVEAIAEYLEESNKGRGGVSVRAGA